MEIKTVGIVGLGTMGIGLVQKCVMSNYRVVVSEISQSYLEKGLSLVHSKLNKAIKKGIIIQKDKADLIDRIKGTTAVSDFIDCDLVIETATENLDTKKKIFIELDHACPPQTILATNTSCLSVTKIALATRRPEKILGLHFFNPVTKMALLEIVRTALSSEETIRIAESFAKSLGKTTVIVEDEPGFIVNGIAIPFIINAIKIMERGRASRDDIDKAVQLGLNHPLGPLALADLIGLDLVYSIGNSLFEETKDPQYTPPVLLKRMIDDGLLGRKAGKGFYTYIDNASK